MEGGLKGLRAMMANIEVIISWGAFATFGSMIITGLGAWGVIYWKIASHEKDNSRHVIEGQTMVNKETCDIKHNNIFNEFKETRAYIGDVKNDLSKKIDDLIKILT